MTNRIPPCEVCGAQATEMTRDHVLILNDEHIIDGHRPRGDPHWRCTKHSRRVRDLVEMPDGTVQAYEPSAVEKHFYERIAMEKGEIDALVAQQKPYTAEDEAFDREWGGEP